MYFVTYYIWLIMYIDMLHQDRYPLVYHIIQRSTIVPHHLWSANPKNPEKISITLSIEMQIKLIKQPPPPPLARSLKPHSIPHNTQHLPPNRHTSSQQLPGSFSRQCTSSPPHISHSLTTWQQYVSISRTPSSCFPSTARTFFRTLLPRHRGCRWLLLQAYLYTEGAGGDVSSKDQK